METIRFDELGLMPQILRGIEEMGFEETTPIQAKSRRNGRERRHRAGTDRTGKDGGIWDSDAAECRSFVEKDTGSDSFSYQGTCDPGGGRASESGQIYARH